ncbi:MAG: hypothetical protein ACI9ON_002244 [Limisphaerales bacterium]
MVEDFDLDDLEEMPKSVREQLEKLEQEFRQPLELRVRTKYDVLATRRNIENWHEQRMMRNEIDYLD